MPRTISPLWTLALPAFLSLCCLYLGEVALFDAYALRWEWPTVSLRSSQALELDDTREDKEVSRILVVSDPHIQCSFDAFEPWLFRWDSDRYVRSAYRRLVNSLRPDLVVVLGDVFAEGYKASSRQWKDYLQVS